MKTYAITEEQLNHLVELTDWEDRLQFLQHIYRTQGPLVPIEQMRAAANSAWGSCLSQTIQPRRQPPSNLK